MPMLINNHTKILHWSNIATYSNPGLTNNSLDTEMKSRETQLSDCLASNPGSVPFWPCLLRKKIYLSAPRFSHS